VLLECDSYSATVDAGKGGMISRFCTRIEDREIDILLPRPSVDAFVDGVPFFGCFAMAPFCNRLRPARIATSDGSADIKENWPTEDCAIHGLALDREWWVLSGGERSCVLSTEIAAGDGRVIGKVEQTVELSDNSGLSLGLSLTNTGFDWVAAGLGFHPWFLSPGSGGVRFNADGIFDTDVHLIPTGHRALRNPSVSLNSPEHDGIDRTYSGWNGSATVDLPGYPYPVRLMADTPCLHVLISRAFNTICAEPVTNVANAMHRAYPEGAMRRVPRGDTMAISMRIALEGPGNTVS